MAPRNASSWKRPYTSIYNDNYRYGTGLYSDTLTDIEKRYTDSLSRTQLRADRPDLSFATFAGSTLAASPTGDTAADDVRPQRSVSRGSDLLRSSSTAFESRSETAFLDEEVQRAIQMRKQRAADRAARAQLDTETSTSTSAAAEPSSRPKSLYDDAAFWSLPKSPASPEPDLSGLRRSMKRAAGHAAPNGPSGWREKSRQLQEQVEGLESSISSCSSKLSSELCSLKSRSQSEMADLGRSMDAAADQSSELQKICKRHHHQLMELQSAYDDSQRNIQDALEEMNLYQNKCRHLKKEMDKLRGDVEQAMTRSNRD